MNFNTHATPSQQQTSWTRRDWLALGAGSLLAVQAPSFAQTSPAPLTWSPSKPLKFIVPYIAGSAPDVLVRALVERLSPALGQPITVDNKPGAGGNLGFDLIAKSPGDGLTLGLATSGLAINPFLYKSVSYKAEQDFAFVNLMFDMPHALIVASDSPFKSVADLRDALKKSPGRYNFSSGGNGTGAHLSGEMFKSMTGTHAVHIPYRGAPEIVTSVLAGDVQFGFPTLSTVVGLAKAGKLRILAVTSERRNAALPDVPTIGETVAGFSLSSWFGLVVPSKTPPEISKRLDTEVARILSEPSFKASMQARGVEVVGMPQSEYTAFFAKDYARYKKLVPDSGARVD